MAKSRRGKNAEPAAPPLPRTFAVAPMAPLYVLTTGVLLAIPTIWAILAVTDPGLRMTGTLMAVGFTAVPTVAWLLLRPSRFIITDTALRIEWPLRAVEVERGAITHVRSMPRSELGAAFGRSFRLVLGGLFGNFGLLWTSKRSWITTYVTSRDTWVLVERRGARPMLISPATPEDFVRALR